MHSWLVYGAIVLWAAVLAVWRFRRVLTRCVVDSCVCRRKRDQVLPNVAKQLDSTHLLKEKI